MRTRRELVRDDLMPAGVDWIEIVTEDRRRYLLVRQSAAWDAVPPDVVALA